MPFAEAAPMSLVAALEPSPRPRALAAPDCPHCGSPVDPASRALPFCCRGCEEVHRLLKDQGLERWYDLARGDGVPAAPPEAGRSSAWLEPLLAEAERTPGPICRLDVDVQGLHCAACVWLMNELFRRHEGGASLTVNPALGRVRLAWRRGRLDVAGFLAEVERFGYRFGAARRPESTSRAWPLRIGVCAALTMNVMLFSASFYVGLAPADGRVFEVFTQLSVALSAGVVAIGGWPFFTAAYQGLRRGVLHLDLPISAGILLAFGTSLVKARDGRGDLAYFDTVDTFVTLMLVGRWLQQRMLDRNRRLLLDDGGAENIHVRRRAGLTLESVRAPSLKAGDRLVIAPGELVPVDAELRTDGAEISTDWINGESAPRAVGPGATVEAGSFNASRKPLEVRAIRDFADSPLPRLLQAGAGGGIRPPYARLVEQIARVYVPVVLALAALGLWLWLPAGLDRALDVTTALLVVTCPCALGLAVPLAAELSLAHLRRNGVFVRAGDLLDRALRLRTVMFDKTGTLTLGRLALKDPQVLETLDEKARLALSDLVAGSNHPVSRCLAEELARSTAPVSEQARVHEAPGLGVELADGTATWRLGRPAWAAPGTKAPDGAAVLARDGALVAVFELEESMRSDARAEVAALQAGGLDVRLVSGDVPEKVALAAASLGIPATSALAAQSPEDKARAVGAVDRGDALFVGDGLNDSLAFARAAATGSPAVQRGVMPGKADFFLLGDGIGGVRTLLAAAHGLRRASVRNLLLALGYNVLAVSACLAGAMTPLRAALFMPLSSVTVLALTAWSLSPSRLAPRAGARFAPRAQEVRR